MKVMIALTLLFSSAAVADLQFNITGASNYINAGGSVSVYYSNIHGSDRELGQPGNYYAWNPKAGGECNPRLNANCKRASDKITFEMKDSVPTSGEPTFWIVGNGTGGAPVKGSSINSYPKILSFKYRNPQTPKYIVGKGSYVNPIGTSFSYTTSFQDICKTLNYANMGVDSFCNPTNVSEPFTPVLNELYVIADANGNGMIDKGEDVVGFTFIVDSTIPRFSSPKGLSGVSAYNLSFDSQAEVHNSIHIDGLTTESTWPNDNGVATESLRFYVVKGPLGSS